MPADNIGLGCHVTQVAGQSVVDSTSPEILLFDAETYDDLGFHDNATNNSRITIPAGVSRIMLAAAASTVDKGAHTGVDFIKLLKNGSVVDGESGQDWLIEDEDMTPCPQFTIPVAVVEDDYFEVQFSIDYSTARDMDINKTWFACWIIQE